MRGITTSVSEQVDLRAVLLADEQRLPRPRGLEDRVAAASQDAPRDGAHLLVVLDEQDRLGAAPGFARRVAATGSHPAFASVRGRYTLKVVPLPGSL